MNAYTQCTRCHGRGYQPEKRKPSKRNPNALGFYARTCPKCDGTGYINTPLEADTLYSNIHGAQLCADCIESEA